MVVFFALHWRLAARFRLFARLNKFGYKKSTTTYPTANLFVKVLVVTLIVHYYWFKPDVDFFQLLFTVGFVEFGRLCGWNGGRQATRFLFRIDQIQRETTYQAISRLRFRSIKWHCVGLLLWFRCRLRRVYSLGFLDVRVDLIVNRKLTDYLYF